MINTKLNHIKFAFLVFYPDSFGHSNGVRVLLDMATMANRLGFNICVVPCYSNNRSNPRYLALSKPYQDLPIEWDIPEGCCAILCDSLQPHDIKRARERATHICHYTLAPLGLFQREGSSRNFLKVLHGERQAVYSPAVSSSLPFFYWQTDYKEIDPWIELSLKHKTHRVLPYSGSIVRTAVYVGKGYPSDISPRIRVNIKRAETTLITRLSPSTKNELYKLLFNSDLIICFDPLTSLALEANLLGVPVFISHDWDEPEFQSNFPVRLDGCSMNNPERLMNILDTGFCHADVVSSYYNAISQNQENLIALLTYAAALTSSELDVNQINSYWQARQPFFSCLQLPSPPGSFDSLSKALPPQNVNELLYDIISRLLFFLTGVKRRCFRFLEKVKVFMLQS